MGQEKCEQHIGSLVQIVKTSKTFWKNQTRYDAGNHPGATEMFSLSRWRKNKGNSVVERVTFLYLLLGVIHISIHVCFSL